MSEMIRQELFPGVWLRHIHTNKFKSAYLSVTLMTDLDEQTAGKAYAFQADLVAQVSNPLASTAPFADWDISFSLSGKAVEDPSVLQRIPDLELFLNALIGLDAAENQDTVGRIRLVIQNYS